MQWILLGVVVMALLAMSSYYPKTAFGFLGALGLAAAVIVFTTKEDAFLDRQQLPVDDIQIENAVFSPGYGNSYQLNARLVNTNPSVLLKDSVLSVTMLDCPEDSSNSNESANDNCVVIGQTDKRISIKIPAQQARDISVNVSFDGAKPKSRDTIRWEYRIIETRS